MTKDALQHLSFPNESADYRVARNALLEAEMELRRHVERVAEQRRALPLGGEVLDYVFEALGVHGMPEEKRLTDLFEDGKDSLVGISQSWIR